jgi:hypothetical protein
MSDGGQERTSLGAEVWKSSQKWSVQRPAVRSIAWFGLRRENESQLCPLVGSAIGAIKRRRLPRRLHKRAALSALVVLAASITQVAPLMRASTRAVKRPRARLALHERSAFWTLVVFHIVVLGDFSVVLWIVRFLGLTGNKMSDGGRKSAWLV